MKSLVRGVLGTFWLVLGGCGSAVLAAAFSPGRHRPAWACRRAFGLICADHGLRHRPHLGCHLNPAVSIGLWAGGRFEAGKLPGYIVSQVLGAIAAGGVLYLIASGKAGFDKTAGFASNGFSASIRGVGAGIRCSRRWSAGGDDGDVPARHPAAPPTRAHRPASRRSPSACA